jgi:hypothetical protein
MADPLDLYNSKLAEFIENLPTDLESNEATTAIKNFETFSKSRPHEPEPEPTPDPEPTTVRGKVGRAVARAWDNETTRVFIKAGGAFAGVAVVTYSTIKRDHVLERQAIDQANQRNS